MCYIVSVYLFPVPLNLFLIIFIFIIKMAKKDVLFAILIGQENMEKEQGFNDINAMLAIEFSIIKKDLLQLQRIKKFGWNIRIKIKPINICPTSISLV